MTTHAKPRARRALDEVRALLGIVVPPGRACLTCGGPRDAAQVCPLCHGKQVNAENLVRAVREVAVLKPQAVGLGACWAKQDPRAEAHRKHLVTGALEALPNPISGSGRLGIKELL